MLLALCLCSAAIHAQSIAFELKTDPDSPIVFVNYSPSIFRTGASRREFVTVKNVSGRALAALIFQQTVSDGSRQEILAIERVSVVFGVHEAKRLSVSVDDAWSYSRGPGKPSAAASRPTLSVVAVEFLDGSTWSAPVARAER